MSEQWVEFITTQQRKIFNAGCGDLSDQIQWHGNRLSKDDWRHFISGTILGWRMLPGIDVGQGAPGFIMLGRSSLELRKVECIDAITLAFHLGDTPWEYEPTQKTPVDWCTAVRLARGITDTK